MQLFIRLFLLLFVLNHIALFASTQSNGEFWSGQSNEDSFLGLPSNAEISDLNLRIVKQSSKYVYIIVSGRVKAAISESSLQHKYRKFVSELEIYEDEFICDDGSKIFLEHVDDGHDDCPDGSDEIIYINI